MHSEVFGFKKYPDSHIHLVLSPFGVKNSSHVSQVDKSLHCLQLSIHSTQFELSSGSSI